jgi:uncharacterized membrane protein YidH (DUF202 family)
MTTTVEVTGAAAGWNRHCGRRASRPSAPSSSRTRALWLVTISHLVSISNAFRLVGQQAHALHPPLERTFLAWLRTSLAFASIGIAVTQLFRLNTSIPSTGDPQSSNGQLRKLSQPLGASFLVISIVILILGYRRYVNGQRWIIQGKFPASRGTIIVVVLVALSIMVMSLAVVIAIQPQAPE